MGYFCALRLLVRNVYYHYFSQQGVLLRVGSPWYSDVRLAAPPVEPQGHSGQGDNNLGKGLSNLHLEQK